MKNKSPLNAYQSDLIAEELEVRQLFSGGIEGLVDTSLIATTYTDEEEKENQTNTEEASSNNTTTEETQRHEVVFVDTTVKDHQALIDDILNNGDSTRKLEIVLLEPDEDGIDTISKTLQNYDDLDAVHIISHGSDGNVRLGNNNLNSETLTENNLDVALWANAFDEAGDILIYGCNLAESEVGKDLINDLSELTLADVAASDDLTGHESLGGDWDLEHQVGDIEATVAPSAGVQATYQHILAVINGTAGDDVLAGTAGNDTISGDAGNDVLVGGGGSDQMLGEAGDDVFRFTDAQDGDVYTVDGGSENDTIDLTEFGSGTVSDDGATITVDLGDSQSFTINYSNIENVITADTAGNHGPTVEAGHDQVQWNDGTFTLNHAVAEDFDGDALTWSWTQIGGPSVTLSDPTAVQPSFMPPNLSTSTTLTFSVVVSDGVTSHVDTVQVTLLPVTEGGVSSDTITGTADSELLIGFGGDDTIDGAGGDDMLMGGAGNDLLEGGEGRDIVSYDDRFGVSVTVDLTLTTPQDTGGAGIDTLSGFEAVQGTKNDDTFLFSNPQDGAVYFVDGNAGTNTIDLSNFASSSVGFGNGTMTIDMGGGQSFTIEYEVIDSIIFSDLTATVLSADMTQAGFSGTGLWIDGAEAFRVDATGAGTLDIAYDKGSDTFSVTGATGVDASSSLAITDLNGTDLRVDQITLNSDFGSLTTNTGVGTISLAGVGSDLNGVFTIGGDLASITMDRLNGTLDVQGDAGTVTIGSEFDGAINVTGSVDTVDVTGQMGGGSVLSVGGDTGSIHVAQDIVSTASVSITGSVTTFAADDRILGSVDIGGDVGLFDLTGLKDGLSDITAGASVTIGGDVTTLTIQGAIKADVVPLLTIDGSVGTMTVSGGVRSDVTIGGDLDAATLGFVDAGVTFTAGQVVGTLVFDVGGTDHGGTYAVPVQYIYDGTSGASVIYPEAPVQLSNTGFTVDEGSTTVITNSHLEFGDAQQLSASVTYTVTTVPTNGQLELITNPDVAISTFTQDDVDNSRVVFVHDGSETTTDSFGFTVDDGQGNYASGSSIVGIGTLTNVTSGISNARAPDYSPDGSQVVFSRNNDIYIMNADGSNQTPLVTAVGGDFQAAWSPDGSKIAFTTNRDGNNEVYVIDVDATNETRITSHAASDSAPAWSPDGSKIAFTSDRDGDKEIWVMDADGTNLVQLTANTAVDGGASWSPDGSKIVFQSTRDGGDYEIYVMDADGSNQTRLTNVAGLDALGDWSPDGSRLLFYSSRDGDNEIYVMDADGGNQVRLTNDAGDDIEAEWSPDGSSILFVSDRDGDYDVYSASVIYENTFAITVTPSNDAPSFIDGAIGNWNFDEGSGDSVAESAIGISGGTLGSTTGVDANDPTWTTGQFGQALHFDGVDDYVEIADAPGIDISGPEFSASLWINPDSGPNTEDMLFMKGDRTGDINYYLSWKDTNVFTWAFREGGVWHYQDMAVTTMPATGEWNHIGITFDRPTVTLYVNGDKYVFDNVATGGSMDNDLTANDDVLMIGAGLSGGSLVGVNQFSGPFSGSIDELALFDRALTDADMEAIRTSAPPVVTASAFSLDENSANNTVVGTVVANDPDVGDTLSYDITAGNTSGAFAIDNNGVITVSNSAALDFETNPVFTLTVEATDDGSPILSDSTTVTISLNAVNEAPTDIVVGSTINGGLNLNDDGGNDTYLVADSGLSAPLSQFTFETQFQGSNGSTEVPFISYNTGSGDIMTINTMSNNTLELDIGTGSVVFSSAINYNATLMDGQRHTLSVSWDNTAGDWAVYIDGALIDSGSGLSTGQTIPTGGTLMFGLEQDSVGGGFESQEFFNGSFFDVRLFDDVRTSTEIADNYDQTLANTEPGMFANWIFDNFNSDGVVTETVSGNNLTEQHFVGTGFTSSSPKLTLSIPKDASNGTAAGTLSAVDPDAGDTFTYTLTDDANGRFDINPGSGEITLIDSSQIDFEAATSHDITVRVTDSGGLTFDKIFTIEITNVNKTPVAFADSYTAVEGIPYTASVGVDDLLLNDSDLDGDTLTVNTTPVSGPANGELVLNADGSFIYTANNNFNGTDSFVYEVSDGNGGTAQATATITVQPREIRILLSTQSDVNTSKVPGIQDWDAGEVLAIGDPNLSFEPAGSDGSLMPYLDLEGFSASDNMTINGMHWVSNDITVGGANSVDLQRGDLLFVAASSEVMTSTNSLAINAGDVIVFRPDTAGDYTSGTFIHLLDQPGTALTTGITLVETNVVVGDVTLQAGDFLFTQEGFVEESSIYYFATTDVGAGTTDGTISTLISSVDIGINFNNFQGIMIVSEDLYLDGAMVPAGAIVTTLANGDSFVGNNGILVDEDELFYLTVSTTTMGSGTTAADATVLFDAGDIGLNNNQKKIQSFTIIEEIRTVNNVDPEITLSAGNFTYTEGDPALLVDPGAVLVDPDSADFDGGLLRVDMDTSGTSTDRLAIRDEGTAAGQIGVSGNTVTYGGIEIGTWAGGSNGGEPLTVMLNASADVSAVQALLRNITYENTSNNPAQTQRMIRFTVSDGDGGVSNTATIGGVINNINFAPVLSGANNLTAISEDLTNSAGTLVSILTSGWISDADAGSVEGIVVVGVDNSNGSWEFTIDGGATWTAFGAPDANNTRLLAANPDTSVRFVPDADWNGTVANGISFHAWDQTAGVNGDEVAITLSDNVRDQFGVVSYSGNDGSALWTSDWNETGDDGAAGSGNVRIDSGQLHLDNQDGGSGEAITRGFDLSSAAGAVLSFDYDGFGSGGIDTVAIEISSDGGATWTVLENLDISGNDSGSRSYGLEAYTDLTADMQLRLRITAGFDTNGQYVNFDNVDIAYSGTGTGGSTSVSTATADSSITVNPVNDAALIGGADTGAVTEDVSVVANNISASGTLTITDPDSGESSFQTGTINGTYGDLVMQTNGDWTYSADNTQAAIQQLDLGESVTDTLTVSSSDGTTHNVVITINGSDDAAVIGGTSTGSVTEDGTLTSSGTLTITDTDSSDPTDFVDVGSTAGDNGYGTFAMTGNTWTYSLDNNHASVQTLDAGETLTDTHTFTAPDGVTQQVTVTINGAEDTPVFDSTAVTSATEDAAYSYTIITSDVDVETVTITAPTLPAWLTLVDNGDRTATLSGTPTNAEVGDHSVVLNVDDGEVNANQSFTITVSNTNDAAVIAGTDTGAVQEDVSVVADNISTSGTLTITDPDTGESSFQAGTINGTYGDLVMQTNGNWNYSADNTRAAIQQLDSGESLTDTLTVTSFDGTTHNVVITINGAEDGSVIGGTATGTVAEDGTLTASNTLTITDVDSNDNPVSFNDVASTASTYGSFEMSGNTWTYTLDNANTTVQALDVTESITDSYTFTATDGSTQTVTVTINGAEDGSVIAGTATGTVAEDGTLTASDTLTITDVDSNDNPVSFNDVASTASTYGNFEMTGNTWTYTLDNANATVQALDVTESISDSYTFTATDGSTQTVTVTINGAEDTPVFDSTAVTSATEDTAYSYSIVTSDVDIEAVVITAPTLPGWLTLTDNGDGTATLSGTPTNAQVGDHSVVLNVNDGEVNSNQSFTITVSNINDAATIGGTDSGAVQEDVAVSANNISTSGTLTISDPDTGESTFQAGTATGTYGSLSIATNGDWTYTADNTQAAIQQLDSGESMTDTLTVTSFDGTTHNLVITLNGSDDAAVIGGTTTGSVQEDGTLTSSGTLTISDTDTSDPTDFVDVASTASDNGYGTFAMTGNSWTFTLNNNHASVQALDVGETLTDTFTFTAPDGASQQVTVTINGAEDIPIFDSTAVTSATEDSAYSYSIATSDVDIEAVTITAPTLPSWLNLTDNGDGTATLSGTPTNAQVGDHSVVLNVNDGEVNSNQSFTITVSNINDAASIAGTDTGAVQEDVAVVTNNINTSGTLTITDPDTGESSFQAGTSNGTYGDLVMQTNGDWTYSADNSQAAIQSLDTGESITDTLTVTSFDGTTHNVVITINGAEDGSVIGGTATGTVAEDGTLTASNTLTITDLDSNDNPVSFNDVTSTASTYGSFEMTGNTWTYTLDNANATVQALDVTESISDSYTFTATDGSTQTVTVTINGAEDGSVIGGTATGTVAEDGTLTASDTLTITDVDSNDNPISFNDVTSTASTYGNFEMTGNTWTYTLDNANATVQALDVTESITDSYTFTATDGSTQTVTVTINGAEDGSVIGGTATGTVAEDGTLTASDTLTITDVDSNDNPISFNDVTSTASTYGNFEMTGNTWTYTLDNANATVQALDVTESITDSYTFTATDGSTQTVTVTINGAEDGSVIGGTATGTVAEDGTLTASNTLTITDVDSNDNPVSFNDVASTASTYGSFEMAGNTWTYTLDNANAIVQALDVTESISDSYTFTATDGSTQTVTVTINGAEDAPVFDSTAVTSATEDSAYSYSIVTSDVDIEAVVITAPTLPGWLTLTDNGDGTATLSGTPTNAQVGDHSVVLNVNDGEVNSNQSFTITVTNTNDAASIAGTDSGAVQEDVSVVADNISTSGTLTIADPDTGESSFVAGTITGTYGDLTIDTAGNWTYSADNTQGAIQQLDLGESITDTLTVTSFDGTTHNVVITINGSDDAAVIGGTTTGSVIEDGTLTSSGTLTITDTDTSDPTDFVDVAPTASDNGYGTFAMTGNTWTYTLDNNHAAVQALDVGESLTDTFTFSAPDGVSQQVSVTINGAEDTPVFDSTAVTAATEDSAYSYSIATSDVDIEAVTITAPTLPAWLTLVDNGDGTGTLSGTPTNTEVGDHIVVLEVFDGSLTTQQNFTITVAQLNDPAVIGGVDTGSVQEDVAVVTNNISTSGTLAIADPDAGESSFVAGTSTGTYGDLTIDAGGNWNYAADNTQAAIQSLDSGESLTDTLTVTSFDGTTHNVVITITGSEDAAVIGGSSTGSVTEDSNLSVSQTLTIIDVDSTDNPVSFTDIAATPGDDGYGTFEISANNWTFILDNTNPAIQSLDSGEAVTDTFTFVASNGMTQQVTVTINGAEDQALISGTKVGTVSEDGPLTASGVISISDQDASDNPISLTDVIGVSSDNGYGDFSLIGGSWVFTLDNTNADVQALGLGQSLNDTVSFTASDGSVHLVSIIINAANDEAVFSGDDSGVVVEDEPVENNTLVTSGTLNVADSDAQESTFVAETIDGNYGELSISESGSWTYSVDNSLAVIQNLDEGDTIADSISVRSADGSTHNINITIYGARDYVVVTGNSSPGEVDGEQEQAGETIDTVNSGSELSTTDVVAGNITDDLVSSVIPEELSAASEQQNSNSQGLQSPLGNETGVEDAVNNFEGDAENTEIQTSSAKEIPAEVKTQSLSELLQLRAERDQINNQLKLSSSDFDLNLDDENQLWKKIDEMQREMDEDSSAKSSENTEIKVALGSTVSLTTGFIAWILRGGSLLASMMTTFPILNRFDPLPILKTRRENIDVDAEDDSENDARVDRMFEKEKEVVDDHQRY